MLTKEQEEKIEKAGNVYYEANITFGQAFVAAIKVYDELKDAEEVKAAVKAANDSNSEEMLLDEAIKHYLDKALNDVSFTCKRDHLRVASWLFELRVRRSRSAAETCRRDF